MQLYNRSAAALVRFESANLQIRDLSFMWHGLNSASALLVQTATTA